MKLNDVGQPTLDLFAAAVAAAASATALAAAASAAAFELRTLVLAFLRNPRWSAEVLVARVELVALVKLRQSRSTPRPP